MAGAADRLMRRDAREDLTGAVLCYGRGAIVAVGPWLFTMVSLVIISVFVTPTTGRPVIADFRAILIYAFALSLLAAAPFVLVTNRLLGDAIHLDERARVQPLIMAGSLAAAISAAALAAAGGHFVLKVADLPLIALMQAAGLAGMIWMHLGTAAAMRDYAYITRIFVGGLAIATAATLAVAIGWRVSSVGMALAFNCGLAVIALGLAGRELRLVRSPQLMLLPSLKQLASAMRRYCWIAIGGGLSALAVWADKLVMWFGPHGQKLPSGLVHAPLYDSAAFLAYLTIIPVLARFVIALDGEYMHAYQAYFSSIREHATLEEIERRSAALGRLTLRLIEDNFIQQAAITAIVVLTAPLIIEATALQYSQVSILRLCAIGVLFQFLFIAASSLLLFFARHLEFFLLQALFAVTNAACTWATLAIGPESYGFGLLLAAVISGVAAYCILCRVVSQIDYFTFVGGAVTTHEAERDTLHKLPCATGTAWSTTPCRTVFLKGTCNVQSKNFRR